MLATRARSVRRRIAELRKSRPNIGTDTLEHYDSGITARLDRTERRMLDLAERLERGSVRSPRAIARVERLANRAGRVAEYFAGLLETIRESRYLAELEFATSRELLDLEGAPFAWPAAAAVRIDRAWRDLAAAERELERADPNQYYMVVGSDVRAALGRARERIARARARTSALRGILRDVDAAGPGVDPEWLRHALAELATEPAELETVIGEAPR